MEKLLHYFTLVISEPIIVDDVTYSPTIFKIQLSRTFFLVDSCSVCSRCCIPEDNIFTLSEYMQVLNCDSQTFLDSNLNVDDLHTLQSSIEVETHMVNSKEVPLYTCKHKENLFDLEERGMLDRCNWVRQVGSNRICGIHPVTSITCKMPHLRFIKRHRCTLSLSMTQYGRNWALGCPIQFRPPTSAKEFEMSKQDRIDKLQALKSAADDVNISNTYLPKLIQYIETCTWNNYESKLRHNILDSAPKVLSNRKKVRSKRIF